jgi:hypothetical protein
MSTLDEKLERNDKSPGARARCYLKRHLQPMHRFEVVERDAQGPFVVTVFPADLLHVWRRVQWDKDSRDWLFEHVREVQAVYSFDSKRYELPAGVTVGEVTR